MDVAALQLIQAQLQALGELVKLELANQVGEKAPMVSVDDALAQLYNAYEEVWTYGRNGQAPDANLADKAIELAAVSLRLVLDIVPGAEKSKLLASVKG